MRFWNREREKEWLKRYLKTEPNAILFVYGPKSSGKSTLMVKVAQELKNDPIEFLWYDLRKYAIEKMEDAISILLGAKGHHTALTKFFDINLFFVSIKAEELMKVFKKEKDPFVLLENELVKLKVNHVSHVIVMTSDTFLIEEVYANSALKNTSRFYLVDYFDDETTSEILREKLPEEQAKRISEWIGGVPWMIEEILESEDREKTLEEMYKQSRAKLEGFLLECEDEETSKEILRKVLEGGYKPSRGEMKTSKRLVEGEILFYDPLRREIRFRTRLDEKVAREILN